MGKFINENLTKDEIVINRCKISYWTIIVAFLGITIGVVLCIVSSMLLKDKMGPVFEEIKTPYILPVFTGLIHGIVTIAFILPVIVMLPIGCELVVTNKRVVGKAGILSFRTVDYHITKIASVNISSSLFGKIFGYMTISIKGLDGAVRPVFFRGIRNAIAFRNSINDQIEAYEEENRKKQAEEIAKTQVFHK